MDNLNKTNLRIDNAFVSDGEGGLHFPNGLTITDNSEQYNGTRYDISTMDLSEYRGTLTVNHTMNVQEIIGKVVDLVKTDTRVAVNSIKLAVKESALARFVHDMILGGFITDFSIETIGPMPDSDGVYRNAKLVGLSVVVMGNNKSAFINSIAEKCINSAKADGLDVSQIENLISIKPNTEGGDNVMQDETKIEETQVEETQVDEEVVEEAAEEAPGVDVENAVKNAVSPLIEKISDLEKKVFNAKAQEPQFKKTATTVNALNNMDWRERTGKQINHAWEYLKGGSQLAYTKLADINKVNLEKLQEAGKVHNSVTLEDFGNFVISPELLTEIEGHRSNYRPLLDRAEWRETNSLQMAWLKRSGDINMSEVEMCDDGEDGNLKPISEYGADILTANLHELAAVTPVCNAATRFLAVDLLGDVAAGYRNDYDRKRAQLMIARMQQAVTSTGNTVTYSTSSDANAVVSWIDAWILAQEEIMNGVFIFSQKTYGELLKRALAAGINGPLAGLFTTGDQPLIAGSPYIVVPNDLMPTLNTAETRQFTVEGSTVTVTQAAFYVDLSTWSGRTSNGLQYDLSTEASYELESEVRSAFQRNELVLRGSFFRNGAIRDEDKVVGLSAPGVS